MSLDGARGAGAEEIIHDRASTALMHQGIGFSDTYIRASASGTSPCDKEPVTPRQRGSLSSLDAHTADVLVSISYVRHTHPMVGREGRGLNPRPITIHPGPVVRVAPSPREPSLRHEGSEHYNSYLLSPTLTT